jgi:hypothetical protein
MVEMVGIEPTSNEVIIYMELQVYQFKILKIIIQKLANNNYLDTVLYVILNRRYHSLISSLYLFKQNNKLKQVYYFILNVLFTQHLDRKQVLRI